MQVCGRQSLAMLKRHILQLSVILALFSNSDCIGQGYDSGFFRTNDGYPRQFSVTYTPTSAPLDLQWYSNDPYVITNIFVTNSWVDKGVGDTSYVNYISASYTPAPRSGGFSSVLFGTYAWSPLQYYDFLPGRTNPSLFKPFPPAVSSTNRTIKFLAEFSIIKTADVAWPTKDRFGFELLARSTNGGFTNMLSLARFDFNPLAGMLTNINTYLFEWRRAGVLQAPSNPGLTGQWPLIYGQLYRITATITGGVFDLDLDVMSSPTGTNVSSARLINGGRLTDGFSSADINTLGVNWQLTSTNPFAPGSQNYLLFNRVAVVPVPTPLESWLSSGGWPASTPPSSKHGGGEFSLLEQYAMGASVPGGPFERPTSRRVVESTNEWFEVVSVVRTNDPSVTVLGEAVGNLASFTVPAAIVEVSGDPTGVAQSGVPAGCQRQVFRVPVGGDSQKFVRLRTVLSD